MTQIEIKEKEIRFKGRVPVSWDLELGQDLKITVHDPVGGETFTVDAPIVSQDTKDNHDGTGRLVSVCGLIRTS